MINQMVGSVQYGSVQYGSVQYGGRSQMASTVQHVCPGTRLPQRAYEQWGTRARSASVYRDGREVWGCSAVLSPLVAGRGKVSRSSRPVTGARSRVRGGVSAVTVRKPVQPWRPARRPAQPGGPLTPTHRVAVRAPASLRRPLPGWLPGVLALGFLIVMGLGAVGVVVSFLSVGTPEAITGALR